MILLSNPVQKIKLFILHGWAVDTNNQQKWQPLIDRLAKMDIDAVFLPLPGLSARLDQVWNLDDYVAWVVTRLPAQPVALLGHSFGGQIAMRLAAKYSHRITKLVLIDSAGIRDQSINKRIKRLGFAFLAKVGRVFTKNSKAKELLYKLAGEKDYLNANLSLRQTMTKIIKTDVQDDAARVNLPTLIIWGGRDQVTPIWMGKRWARLIRFSQLAIIEPARHSPQFTHTNEVAELIERFLF